MPRIGGNPGGTSCGKTSANSCKMLVTAGGKEEGTSSNENNAYLHTKAYQTDLLKSSLSISDLVASKHPLFNLISEATWDDGLLLGFISCSNSFSTI